MLGLERYTRHRRVLVLELSDDEVVALQQAVPTARQHSSEACTALHELSGALHTLVCGMLNREKETGEVNNVNNSD